MLPLSLPLSPDFLPADLLAVILIGLFAVFSLVSIYSILRFHLKSRHSSSILIRHHFHSLWPVRLLLVLFALLLSLSYILRLPFRRPTLCKLHVVAAQGLFQPAFLVSLLILLNATLHKPNALRRAVSLFAVACLPLVALHALLAFSPHHVRFWLHAQLDLPRAFFQYYYSNSAAGAANSRCMYPLIDTLLLGAFGAGYAVCFLLACWRAAAVAINRSLRVRIWQLGYAVAYGLSVQFLCLVLMPFWRPGQWGFELLSLAALVAALSCAVVGECTLVICPIVDALEVGG